MKRNNSKSQAGAVALFTVLFATLLITVLTVGFLRLMIQEQQRAQNQDLAQSALDSATSGVEDAKRVIRKCAEGNNVACKAIEDQQCDTVLKAQVITRPGTSSKTTINSGDAGTESDLNQAYTCVIIDMLSPDFIGNLEENKSQVIPLRADGSFNKIVIEWMHKNNGGGGAGYSGGDVDYIETPPPSSGSAALPQRDAWSEYSPALLRVQTVLPPSPSKTVSLAELDTSVASTVFLKPAIVSDVLDTVDTLVSVGADRAADLGIAATPNEPASVTCSNKMYTDGSYACRATLQMVSGEVASESPVAFLRLTSLYGATSYRVSLAKDATPANFDGVQPSVDSTGSASNVFRRIKSRLLIEQAAEAGLPLPDAAIDVTGNLCKDFFITDETSETMKSCRTR